MKFTISIAVLSIDDRLFDLIEKINSNSNEFEIILLLPQIPANNNFYKLNEYIRNNKNIQIIELSSDNINDGRNKSVELSSGEYILFIDTYTDLNLDHFLEVSDYLRNNKVDVLMLDYLQKNDLFYKLNKSINKIDVINEQVVISNKDYLQERKICLGIDFYKISLKKDLNILSKLNNYLLKVDFLKSNNLIFNNNLIFYHEDFIIESIVKSKTISYLDLALTTLDIKDIKHNDYYLKYDLIKSKLDLCESLLKLYNKCRVDAILYNLSYLYQEIITHTYNYNDYDNYMYVLEKVKKINKLINEDKNDIELDIIYDILEDVPIILNKSVTIKNNNFNKIINNTVYELEKEIFDIKLNDKITTKNINELKYIINKNKNIMKYKNYDIIMNLEKESMNIETLEKIVRNLQIDIQSNMDNNIRYYSKFEETFDTILRSKENIK